MSDRRRLYTAAFVRALATGMVGVLLGLYLDVLQLAPRSIGFIVSAGLAGVALGTLVVMLLGDRVGHRRALVVTALATAAGGAVLALGAHPALLGIAAFLGMTNGMGRDRGAALVLEQAVLPGTSADSERTMVFARYNVMQDLGHALGGLLAGLPTLLQAGGIPTQTGAFRASMAIYTALSLVPLVAYAGLSRAVETPAVAVAPVVSPATRRILWRLSALSAMDSLG